MKTFKLGLLIIFWTFFGVLCVTLWENINQEYVEEWFISADDYVLSESGMLELDEEQLELYNDITTLINGLNQSRRNDNATLVSYLDTLRKNLQNKNKVFSTVISIYELMETWILEMDASQNNLLHSVLDRLSNDDIASYIGSTNIYADNKAEILAILPDPLKQQIQQKFLEFEDHESESDPNDKFRALASIFNTITQADIIDRVDVENIILPDFCNILEYYEISEKTRSCIGSEILNNYEEVYYESDINPVKIVFISSLVVLLLLWLWILWCYFIKSHKNK